MKTPGFLTGGLALISAFAFSVAAGDFKHIAIDGSFDDWAGIPPAFEDSADTTSSIDYATVYTANDVDYLYLRFTLHTPGDPFTSRENIFINADNDFDGLPASLIQFHRLAADNDQRFGHG